MGHARALLALDDPKMQIRIYNEILSQGYSVRKVEELVKALSNGEEVESGGKKSHRKGLNFLKCIPCCRIISVRSLAQKCNFHAARRGKEK